MVVGFLPFLLTYLSVTTVSFATVSKALLFVEPFLQGSNRAVGGAYRGPWRAKRAFQVPRVVGALFREGGVKPPHSMGACRRQTAAKRLHQSPKSNRAPPSRVAAANCRRIYSYRKRWGNNPPSDGLTAPWTASGRLYLGSRSSDPSRSLASTAVFPTTRCALDDRMPAKHKRRRPWEAWGHWPGVARSPQKTRPPGVTRNRLASGWPGSPLLGPAA